MNKAEIGKRIKLLRIANNYNREVFAYKVGISTKFLYEIENGKKGFSADILGRIATTLNVSCDFVIHGREYDERNVNGDIATVISKFDDEQMRNLVDILSSVYDISRKRI